MDFSESLENNIEIMKNILHNNGMIVYRFIENSFDTSIKACIIFCDGLAGATLLNESIVKPFVKNPMIKDAIDKYSYTKNSVVFSNEVTDGKNTEQCVTALFSGDAVMFVEGCSTPMIINVRAPFIRSISESDNEKTLKGPRDSFGELILQNTALLMRRIKNENFRLEKFIIGKDTQTSVIMCYIEDICHKDMIDKVRKGLKDISINSLTDTNEIAELIKGRTYTPFKTSGSSQRPDVIANKLLEGRIAIMIDGSPQVITLPFLFSEYFKSNDDYTINFYFAGISRLIRFLSFFISVYLPAIYVCALKFHKEILPKNLLFSLSEKRASAPFSVAVEVIIFLIFFEIIREAATRTPSAIGQTMSIVGGLILSETAASANIVSTPSIIVIAIAGITTMILPSMAGPTTMLRILFVIISSFLGFYGLCLGTILLITHLCSIDILDIAYVNSTIPLNRYSVSDTLVRFPYKLLDKMKKSLKRKY